MDIAGCEKITNPVISESAIHVELVIADNIERTKSFCSLGRAPLQVRIEHLFPTRRMEAGGIRDHTVEVKQDGVELLAVYRASHRTHPLAQSCLAATPPDSPSK